MLCTAIITHSYALLFSVVSIIINNNTTTVYKYSTYYETTSFHYFVDNSKSILGPHDPKLHLFTSIATGGFWHLEKAFETSLANANHKFVRL